MSRFKRTLAWLVGEVLTSLVYSYWPVYGAPVVTGILAYLDGYEWTLIFMFSLGSMGMALIALNQWSVWRFERSPENKLQFVKLTLGTNENKTKNEFPVVVGAKFGIQLLNRAKFPIEVKMDSLDTQLANKVPIEKFKSNKTTIGMGGIGHFTAASIDIRKEVQPHVPLSGSISARIKYGRPGKLRYNLDIDLNFILIFDDDGKLATADHSITEMKAVSL